jgi:hypothetical protein
LIMLQNMSLALGVVLTGASHQSRAVCPSQVTIRPKS